MSLERRVDRLEARAPGGRRCGNCAAWPKVRIENPKDWRAGGRPTVTGAPERCPACGWAPQVVVIVREKQPTRGGAVHGTDVSCTRGPE